MMNMFGQILMYSILKADAMQSAKDYQGRKNQTFMMPLDLVLSSRIPTIMRQRAARESSTMMMSKRLRTLASFTHSSTSKTFSYPLSVVIPRILFS